MKVPKIANLRLAIVLEADGGRKYITLHKKETLEQLQEWVGGYIQRTRVRFEGKMRDLWVNEEGLIKELPFNRQVTALIAETHNKTLGQVFPIVGNCVVIIPNFKD